MSCYILGRKFTLFFLSFVVGTETLKNGSAGYIFHSQIAINQHAMNQAVTPSIQMDEIKHKMIKLPNGLNMHIAEKGEGPIILFLHGFPELWYSWRHQITFMASHGYRAVAPDLRGYGDTTGAPTHDASKFTTLNIVGDLVLLLDAIITEEDEKVFVVGHDWGAIIAWHMCLYRPDKVKGLVNLSVEFVPWNPLGNYAEQLRQIYGDNHYMHRFQVPGEIEAVFESIGIRNLFKGFLSSRNPGPLLFPKDQKSLDAPPHPIVLPSWISEDDLEYYISKFEKTGLTGGINYYRALHSTWEHTAVWHKAKVMVPTKFVVGDLDLTYYVPGVKEYLHDGGMLKDVLLLQEVVVLKDTGHFINQERAQEINIHILDFFKKF